MVQPWGGHVSFTLVPGGTQLTSFTLERGNSYLSPPLDGINFTLEGEYTAPLFTVIDFTLTPEHVCPPYVPPVGNVVNAILFSGYVVPGQLAVVVVLDPCDVVGPTEPQVLSLYLSVKSSWGAGVFRSVAPIQSSYGFVPRKEVGVELPYEHPHQPVSEVVDSSWNGTPRKDIIARTSWNPGEARIGPITASWSGVVPQDLYEALSWNPARPLPVNNFDVDWNRVFPYDRFVSEPWNPAQLPGLYVDPPPYVVEVASDGIALPGGARVNFLLKSLATGSPSSIILREEVIVRARTPEQSLNFSLEATEDYSTTLVLTGRAAYIVPHPDAIVVTLNPLYVVPTGLEITSVLGARASTTGIINPDPYIQQRADPLPWSVLWNSVPTRDARETLPWGAGHYGGRDPIIDGPWVNDPPPPPIPPGISPPLPVYIVMNSISVVRLPNREQIQVTGFSISGSEDPLWMFRGDLANPNQLALLKKDSDGPKEIEVTINGHVWSFVVEDYDDGREFNDWRVSFNGRSRTALLSDPYAPRRSYINDSPITIQQLIARELENTGFTLDYATVDWVVPIGGWYYQDLTPMEAILKLAESAGAVVQSDMNLKQIRVAPKYPVSPWNWVGAQLDKAINDDQIRSLSFQNKTLPLYDFVLVSGDTQGVSDIIQRTGSGGEVRAPMVVDPLILDHPASMERGRNILSDRGEQGIVTVALQLNPETTAPGLILPLHLVEVEETPAWIGKCTSTEVSVNTTDDGTVEVWMTNLLERHYSDAN